MTYLILQILFCLLIAFIFGFILGWLFGGVKGNKNQITQSYTPRRESSTAKLETSTKKAGTYHSNFTPPPPAQTEKRDITPPPPPPARVEKREAAPPPPPPPPPPTRTEARPTPPPPPPPPAPEPKKVEPVKAEPVKVEPVKMEPTKIITPYAPSANEVNLSMKGYEIETLEGVGPKTGVSLRGVGIETIADFLVRAHSPAQRAEIASDVAVRPKMVDSWASMSDLLRINGVDHQAAELMHKSGINSVTDLSTQNATTFIAQMEATNNAGKRSIAPEVPSNSLVTDWISQSSSMRSAIQV